MADISFTNLTNLPPEIATSLEEINRKKRIQDALMAQTMQQPQTQVARSGPFSVAVPYSPWEGATQLIKAAMLNKMGGQSDERLNQLGADYTSGSNEVVRNLQAQAAGGVPWRNPDPRGAIMSGAGSVYPEARRVSNAMLDMQRAGGANQARPTGSTSGYFVMENGQPKMLSHPESGQPLVPSYADPGMRQQFQYGGTMGTGLAERTLDQPKAEMAIEQEKFKLENLDKTVDTAIDQAGGLAATAVGAQLTSWIGGSPAGDLAGTLSTIEAEAGFGRLQQMRDTSKTGGALGQVSERELDLLKASFAALKQSQSKEQLVRNLNNFKRQYRESWKNINKAYKKDYGVYYLDPKAGFGKEGTETTTPAADAPIDDLINFYK